MPERTEGDSGTGGEAADPHLGQEVAGRYRVVAAIGRGGMGTVYEIEHLTTARRFALKMLLPEFGKVGELAQRFAREARAQSRLSHPHIVQVSDFGALDDGTLFYVMELVRGKSLGEVLETKQPMSPERALRIARRTLEGLSHAHSLGVVHRDLKPDNIMLVETGDSEEERDVVKLLDFGIAKLVGDAEAEVGGKDKLTQAGVAFGTPDYMAPEQALGEPVDGRADIYAVGVMMFEMLTGRKPFQSDDKLAVVRMQVAVEPPSLAAAAPGLWFSPGVERLVARALEKRREDRFSDCDAMIARIDELSASVPSATGVGVAPTVAFSTSLARARSVLSRIPEGLRRVGRIPAALLHMHRRTKILAVSGGALALLVVVALLSNSGGPRVKVATPTVPAHPLRPAAAKTELAARAEAMLEKGDLERVVALMERELAAGDGLRDAYGHLALGHARFRLGRDVEALAAYEKAVELGEELGRNAILQRNIGTLLERKDKTVAMAALDVANKMGEGGEGLLVEAAGHNKMRELRLRARQLADKRGLLGRVDKLESYALDLKDGKSCPERREAIPKLRALLDKNAVPILKKARNRGGGWFGLQDVNQCLVVDADEAIAYLEGLP